VDAGAVCVVGLDGVEEVFVAGDDDGVGDEGPVGEGDQVVDDEAVDAFLTVASDWSPMGAGWGHRRSSAPAGTTWRAWSINVATKVAGCHVMS